MGGACYPQQKRSYHYTIQKGNKDKLDANSATYLMSVLKTLFENILYTRLQKSIGKYHFHTIYSKSLGQRVAVKLQSLSYPKLSIII